MLKIDERIACAEALAVYNLLEEDVKKAIPEDFIKYLGDNATKDVEVNITSLIPLDMQNISEEGYNLIKKMSEFIKN